MRQMLNVLVVDDHPIVRAGIHTLLRRSPGLHVCGEAADVATAEAQTRNLRPDLIILDLMLGGRDGLDLIKTLKLIHPRGKILVYSTHDENVYARRAIEAGASGYLTKRIDIKELQSALEMIAQDQCYVSESVKQAYMTELMKGKKGREGAHIENLSGRELQILHLLGMGLSSAQISAELNLSIKTIGTFRERLKDKLNLSSARELENYAVNFVRNANSAQAA